MRYFISSKNKKRKSKGKGKKTKAEGNRPDDGEDEDKDVAAASQRGGGVERGKDEAETLPKSTASFLYPSWKLKSSDSEYSDPEGSAQGKLRYIESSSCAHIASKSIFTLQNHGDIFGFSYVLQHKWIDDGYHTGPMIKDHL